MKPGMLTSQLETLEIPSPDEALHVSIHSTPEEIVAKSRQPCFRSPVSQQISSFLRFGA